MQTSSQVLSSLADGRVTSGQLLRDCLSRIDSDDAEVNAFITLTRESAIREAEESDRRRAAGRALGPLDGVPVALKDNLSVQDVRMTCGSRMLESFVPPYDAHVVTQLRAAGAVLVGKTNMDEFAMGSSTETSAFGVTRNPRDRRCSPGGSSGGSAAAVAAGFVPLAVGSDTGGSIRQPAAFCGVVGLKPTYARVSRYGLVAFASSLDQIGPMSTDVAGAAALLEVLSGHDPRDSTSVQQSVPPYTKLVHQPPQTLTVGVAREFLTDGLTEEVRQSFERGLDALRTAGATIRDISLPHTDYAVAAYYLIAPSEASSNLARYDGVHYGRRAAEYQDLIDLYRRSRAEGFGAEVKRRIMLGTWALSAGYYDAYYARALRVRRLIRDDYDRAFAEVDVIATPTTPTVAFPLGQHSDDPLSMYLNDICTISANLAGLPAVSVPIHRGESDLPAGFQLTAPAFAETRLLQAAAMLERQLQEEGA